MAKDYRFARRVGQIPDTDGAIEAIGQQGLSIWCEVLSDHLIGMALQGKTSCWIMQIDQHCTRTVVLLQISDQPPVVRADLKTIAGGEGFRKKFSGLQIKECC